jgi:hypothetical protein
VEIGNEITNLTQFGFFQNVGKVFGTGQNSNSRYNFFPQFFFQDFSIAIEQNIKKLGDGYL